jgi:threonine dehydratase
MRRSVLHLSSITQTSAVSWLNPAKDKHFNVASEYLPKILTSQVYEIAVETLLSKASNLSANLGNGNTVYLKREDTQPVFSFKIRGAYNKIANIPPDLLRSKGIVTCSAGNHAQGVALSACHLGIDATIVMPLATPSIKVYACSN